MWKRSQGVISSVLFRVFRSTCMGIMSCFHTSVQNMWCDTASSHLGGKRLKETPVTVYPTLRKQTLTDQTDLKKVWVFLHCFCVCLFILVLFCFNALNIHISCSYKVYEIHQQYSHAINLANLQENVVITHITPCFVVKTPECFMTQFYKFHLSTNVNKEFKEASFKNATHALTNRKGMKDIQEQTRHIIIVVIVIIIRADHCQEETTAGDIRHVWTRSQQLPYFLKLFSFS